MNIMKDFNLKKYLAKNKLNESTVEETTEREVYDDIIKLIKSESMKYGSKEIDEARDVMEFIGQHYGINIEFTRF
jgi:hypothetical protein